MKTFLLSSFFRKHNSHEFAGIVWIPGCTNKMLVTKMRGKKRKKNSHSLLSTIKRQLQEMG